MDFKYSGIIELRDGVDYWGPYSFDMTKLLPSGQSVSSVSIEVYEGKITEKNYESSLVDISSFVIDSYDVSLDHILIYFQYPGSVYKESHLSIRFLISTNLSGVTNYFPVYFTNIKVI